MPSRILPFEAKPSDYFENARLDLVAALPAPIGRVLDVGCGAGAVGRALRARGADHLVGIEYDEVAAERARTVFDEVVVGDAEEAVVRLEPPYDTICCYDVLEHLFDPVAVAEQLLRVAAPGARLHVSVPNVRHFSLFRDLLLRGTFGYQTVGHRDVTHLRWFTRSDIETLLSDCGWSIEYSGSNALRPGRALLSSVTGGYAREFFAVQWYILARAPR